MQRLKRLTVGIDEVGIGCIAGPIVIAAVALPRGFNDAVVRDSKKVSKAKMMSVCSVVQKAAVWRKCLSVSVSSIDRLGTWKAWERGVGKLVTAALDELPENTQILLDGTRVPPRLQGRVIAVKGGDNTNYAIAAASIVAKTFRDQYMIARDKEHPEYGWGQNMGYPTKQHTDALFSFGMTPQHRLAASKTCRINVLKKENL